MEICVWFHQEEALTWAAKGEEKMTRRGGQFEEGGKSGQGWRTAETADQGNT